MKVAVVGAGAVGCSVARALALGGASVVLLDARRPGSGTSSTTFAWVNAHRKRPRSYHDLNVAGLTAHHRLQAGARNASQWFVPSGNIEWGADERQDEQLRLVADRLREWDYPVREISGKQASELAPDVRFPSGVNLLYYPTEGYVMPWLLLARLLGEARDLGAEIRSGSTVARIDNDGSGATIGLQDGTTQRFDAVICCAGRWTGALMKGMDYRVHLADPDLAGSATVGYLGWTRPGSWRVPAVITAPTINIRPDGGGRLVLQSLDLDDSADPANPPGVDGEVAYELRRRFAEVVVDGEAAAFDSLRVGQRVLPADGLTVAGFLDAHGSVYVVATHSGITLGPFLGEVVAEEVLTGHESPMLSDFRPGRFTGRASFPDLTPARRQGEQ